jgi:signal transduction histidine kinase
MPPNPNLFKLSLSMKFIILCGITLTIALGVSFYIIAKQQERLIMEQIEFEARALFKHIVITRKWISDHQGVFVEKLPWVKENPYLRDIKTIEPEITDTRGRKYVRKNPAMVTRELSEYAKEKGLFWFHITSLKLMNPNNNPDEFEKNALYMFENKKSTEMMAATTINNTKYFRYISPLYVEDSCLGCHAHQGYEIGDIRGAISITIPVENTFAYIASNKNDMFIAGLFTVSSLIMAMFILMRILILKPLGKIKTSIEQVSDGKYHTMPKLQTGDELEELSISFANMAKTLSEYHAELNDKIKDATEGLETTNARLMEMNNLLNEANIRKSDFIARASHELRTPLTSIKGAIDYINARLTANSIQNQQGQNLKDVSVFCDIIRKNTERLIKMVNDMLDLERIELGKSELNLANVNISDLIEEVIGFFRLEAEKRNIKLTTNLNYNLLIYVDEERIKQVLTNLLTNAIKFSPDNSEIIISADASGGSLTVKICDQGAGIPRSKQDIIFEKFVKYGNKEGTGLGLAISKSIIEAHRGIIGVESDGQSGSSFYFSLPLGECENKRVQ